MLPELRSDEAMLSIPKFDIQRDDIKGFISELRAFHEVFIDFRVNNATVRAKKGANRIVGCRRVKGAERQQGGRFPLPVHPSTLPGYLDGRWPRCS